MTRRGWTTAIMVAWATSLGWLVKREVFVTTAARLAEAARSVAPSAVYYRLAVGGQQVGFASSTIDTSGSAIRVEDLLVLDVPAHDAERDRKSTRLNSSHCTPSRMPSSA